MFWLVLCLAGLFFCGGLLGILGGMMSDAPSAGNQAANQGLVLLIISMSLVLLDLVARHYHWFRAVHALINWGDNN